MHRRSVTFFPEQSPTKVHNSFDDIPIKSIKYEETKPCQIYKDFIRIGINILKTEKIFLNYRLTVLD